MDKIIPDKTIASLRRNHFDAFFAGKSPAGLTLLRSNFKSIPYPLVQDNG